MLITSHTFKGFKTSLLLLMIALLITPPLKVHGKESYSPILNLMAIDLEHYWSGQTGATGELPDEGPVISGTVIDSTSNSITVNMENDSWFKNGKSVDRIIVTMDKTMYYQFTYYWGFYREDREGIQYYNAGMDEHKYSVVPDTYVTPEPPYVRDGFIKIQSKIGSGAAKPNGEDNYSYLVYMMDEDYRIPAGIEFALPVEVDPSNPLFTPVPPERPMDLNSWSPKNLEFFDNKYFTAVDMQSKTFTFYRDHEYTVKIYYELPKTINFNGNGNTAGTSPVDSNTYYKQDTIVVPDKGDLERYHYDFVGWSTSQDGSGTLYLPGDTLSIDSDLILYAQWRKKSMPSMPDVELGDSSSSVITIPKEVKETEEEAEITPETLSPEKTDNNSHPDNGLDEGLPKDITYPPKLPTDKTTAADVLELLDGNSPLSGLNAGIDIALGIDLEDMAVPLGASRGDTNEWDDVPRTGVHHSVYPLLPLVLSGSVLLLLTAKKKRVPSKLAIDK